MTEQSTIYESSNNILDEQLFRLNSMLVDPSIDNEGVKVMLLLEEVDNTLNFINKIKYAKNFDVEVLKALL